MAFSPTDRQPGSPSKKNVSAESKAHQKTTSTPTIPESPRRKRQCFQSGNTIHRSLLHDRRLPNVDSNSIARLLNRQSWILPQYPPFSRPQRPFCRRILTLLPSVPEIAGIWQWPHICRFCLHVMAIYSFDERLGCRCSCCMATIPERV